MAEDDPIDTGEEPAEKKSGFGRKLLGLFVESESKDEAPRALVPDDDERPSAEEIAVRTPPSRPVGPVPGGTPTAVALPTPAPVVPTGARPTPPASYKIPDIQGILKSGGLPDDDRDRLNKAEELLRNLPAETPLTLKRQIVEASLRAFGIPPERLVLAAEKAIKTLETYHGIGEQDLEQRIGATGKRVAELEAEIARLSAGLTERRQMQDTLTYDLRARQSELRSIVEFFGVPPAPPKA